MFRATWPPIHHPLAWAPQNMSLTASAIWFVPSSCRSDGKHGFPGSGQGLFHNSFRASYCQVSSRVTPCAPIPLHRHRVKGNQCIATFTPSLLQLPTAVERTRFGRTRFERTRVERTRFNKHILKEVCDNFTFGSVLQLPSFAVC